MTSIRVLSCSGVFVRSVDTEQAQEMIQQEVADLQEGRRPWLRMRYEPGDTGGGALLSNGLANTKYTHRREIPAEVIDRRGRRIGIDPAKQNARNVLALRYIENDLRPVFTAVLDSVSV